MSIINSALKLTGNANKIAKATTKVSKKSLNKIVEGTKTTVCKSMPSYNSWHPERMAVMRTDSLLKTGLKLQGEVPIDQFLRQIPEAQRKAVAEILGNPETVQFAAKHSKKGRFSILGFIGKKGDKTVGKGAISITDAGEPNAVMKFKVSTGTRGQNLQANGFVDCAPETTDARVTATPSFIKKMLGMDIKVGETAAAHVQVNPTKAAKLLAEGKTRSIDLTNPPTLNGDVLANKIKSIGNQLFGWNC